MIMVKNTITRWIFRRKSSETAPKRGANLVEKNPAARSDAVL